MFQALTKKLDGGNGLRDDIATAASTAIAQFAAVKVVAGVVSEVAAGEPVMGVSMEAKAATDTSTDPIQFRIMDEADQFIGNCNTAVTSTDLYSEYNLVDASNVDTSAAVGAGTGDVTLVGLDGASTTKGVFKFNRVSK